MFVCAGERLNNVDILLGRSQGPYPDNVTYETCASVPGVLGRQTVVNCTRRSCSQYVRIKLNDEGVLTLCEVEVYGDYSIHGKMRQVLLSVTIKYFLLGGGERAMWTGTFKQCVPMKE